MGIVPSGSAPVAADLRLPDTCRKVTSFNIGTVWRKLAGKATPVGTMWRKLAGKITPEHWQVFKENAKFFVQVGAAITVFQTYVAELTVCVGPSMLPTFNNHGDVVIFERISARSGDITRGDVIVSRSPTNPVQLICKRVVGMEGDSIITNQSPTFGCSTCVVPPGHVWLAGDNTANSTDSRMYGPIPYALIQGRVCLKVWPPSEFGWVKNALEPISADFGISEADQSERINNQQ